MAFFKRFNAETEILHRQTDAFKRETYSLKEAETYEQARLFYKTPLKGEELKLTKLEYYNTF